MCCDNTSSEKLRDDSSSLLCRTDIHCCDDNQTILCCDNTSTDTRCDDTRTNMCSHSTFSNFCCDNIHLSDTINQSKSCNNFNNELCCHNTVTINIQNQIDECLQNMYKPWSVPIYVNNTHFRIDNLKNDQIHYISHFFDLNKHDEIDILSCTKIHVSIPPFLYFDQTVYDTTNGFQGKGYGSLIVKLNEVFDAHGFGIASNGSTTRSKYDPSQESSIRNLRCTHGRIYCREIKSVQLQKFRETSITNDKVLNNRGKEGKKMPRRKQVFRPTDKDKVCSFNFNISFDNHGFYIVNGYGNNTHCFHKKSRFINNSTTTKSLSCSDQQLTHDIIKSSGNSGIIRNLLFLRKKKIYSLHNIMYINKKIQNSDNTGLTDEDATADKILQYFHENNFQYYCLTHDGSPESLVNNGGGIVTEDNPYYQRNDTIATNVYPNFLDQCTDKEKNEIKRYIRQKRMSMNIPQIQILLMSIAWVTPFEKRLFTLFPEVLYCDVICGTNNENRPLFTVTGKDASGKMFTLFRAFLPNQKQWSFRWLFNVVFPQVFTGSILNRVNCIITDGDTQQITQLDAALTKHFPNARRVRCGWHVCNRTFERHGPRLENYVSPHAYELILTNCMGFVYSWMKPSCETRLQFLTSKYLFWRYLHSTFVRNTVGESFVSVVTSLMRNYIEVVEEHFVFYKRNKLRNFEAYSNSCHEGTNNAIKHMIGGVNGRNLLDVSCKKLSFVAELKYEEARARYEKENISTKVWNPLHCSQYLTILAGNLLLSQLHVKDRFKSVRTKKNEWKVKLEIQSSKKNPHKIQPDFINVRTVIEKDSILHCNCYFFNRIGIICRHMLHILYKDPNYIGPSHHDIAVRWWSVYSDRGQSEPNSNDDDSKISKLLDSLYENDTQGPKILLDNYNEEIQANIESEWNIKPEDILMHNYHLSEEIIEKILSQSNVFGLSQTSNNDYDIDITEEAEVQIMVEEQFQDHFDNFFITDYHDSQPKKKKRKILHKQKKTNYLTIVCFLSLKI